MASKLIHTETNAQGVLNLTVQGLPPGQVDVILLIPDTSDKQHSVKDVKKLPLGGHKAGWLEPEQLRREFLYEDEI